MRFQSYRRRLARFVLSLFAITGFTIAGALLSVANAQTVKKIAVVATTGMVADAAKAVAGDRAEVAALMGPGVDPHLYRQTRSDVIKLSRADIVFYNGLYLEAQLEELLLELGKTKTVVAVAQGAPREKWLAHDNYKDKFDPHMWMDPALWSYAVGVVRNALIKQDPAGTAAYEANAAKYLQEIGKLAVYAKKSLETVPANASVLISAHDAFNYFGKAYGFEVLGVQGMSTESEAGLKQIEDMVELLVNKKVGAIFVESSVSDRNVKALIEGAAAKGHTVKVGGQLFSDAMGSDRTYEGTYIGMIDHNATVITRALGGQAPEKGLNGKLGAGS
ncbi:MAG: zinc ABC transporter substrate-binding protein [Chitinophagales bacterium]|nr:zinc ABC transporter substrate-binding protein [Hyphomicrobiales bacterium]